MDRMDAEPDLSIIRSILLVSMQHDGAGDGQK